MQLMSFVCLANVVFKESQHFWSLSSKCPTLAQINNKLQTKCPRHKLGQQTPEKCLPYTEPL